MSRANLTEQAIKHREIGSELQDSENFYDTLVSLNKNLSHFELGSEKSSVAFRARSEIYYKVGQFKKCLENISLAREKGFSDDRGKRLDELESKCKEQTEINDLSGFTKLSHPPNQNIPFLIESLQLRENEEFGRFIISSEDLQVGDVIAFEEAEFTTFSPKSICTRCFNCLRANMLNLIPSKASGKVLKAEIISFI